jgi:hypothetical protein
LTTSNPLLPQKGRGVNLLCPMLRGACGLGWTTILFRSLLFDCWGGSRIVVIVFTTFPGREWFFHSWRCLPVEAFGLNSNAQFGSIELTEIISWSS